MSTIKTPFIERNTRYSTTRFESNECIMQKYMALFLSKPELYSNVLTSIDKQELFFLDFKKFIENYIVLNSESDDEYKFDMEMYFSALNTFDVNKLNITGGESRTAGAKKAMLNKYYKISENRKIVIDYLNKKYNWNLASSDPRLFLGHSQPWLNPSPALLVLQGWDSIIKDISYDDETMTKPLPENLDKNMIPLKIRNKVYTAWKNKKDREAETARTLARQRELEEEEAPAVKTVNNEETEEEKKLRLQMLAASIAADLDEDW